MEDNGFAQRLRERLLAEPRRRQIHELLSEKPGLHVRRIQRELGVTMSTVQHHLRVLSAAGLVTCRRHQSRAAYFVAGQQNGAEQTAFYHLRSRTARRILTDLLAQPGMSLRELLARVPRGASTIFYHLQRLETAGLVESASAGRVRVYRVAETQPVEAVLQRYQASFRPLQELMPQQQATEPTEVRERLEPLAL